VDFKQAELNNGLKIIAEVSPAAASMALGFFVRTGSRDETDDVHGVSHFLEHMMFKGTDRRSALDVNREFDEMGANYNAFTSEENTVYYAAVLPEFQAAMVDLLGDVLRPSLRQEDFDTEKKVILEEIALYEDRPDFRLYEKLMGQYFSGHPLGRSVLGTPRTIADLTRDAMAGYFERRYSPPNVIAVAAGNLDWEALVVQIGRACGEWEPFETSRSLPDVPTNREQTCVADEKLVRQHIGLAGRAPSAQSESRYAGQLLATILGDHTGSRLYYALIEPAIADDASVVFDALDHTGAMLTFLTTDPDRAGEALAIVREEFERFRRTGPAEDELAAAKNKIASGSVIQGELPMGRLTAVGFEWLYRHEYVPLDDQIEQMMAVTAEQVIQVAREYDLNDTTMLALGPRSEI